MIEVGNPNTWAALTEGKGIPIKAGRPRVMTITVRAEQPAQIGIATEKGEYLFLGRVETIDRIRFQTLKGEWAIVSDVPVHVRSIENNPASVKFEDPEVFTEIWERKPRNPALEQMMGVMHENMQRLQAQLSSEYERRSRQQEAAYSALVERVQKREKVSDDDGEQAGGKGAAGAPKQVKPAKAAQPAGGAGNTADGAEKPAASADGEDD